MFSRTEVQKIALILFVIFGITVIMFPLIYSPSNREFGEDPVSMELDNEPTSMEFSEQNQ